MEIIITEFVMILIKIVRFVISFQDYYVFKVMRKYKNKITDTNNVSKRNNLTFVTLIETKPF